MLTIEKALQATSAYPIPRNVIESIALKRGLDLSNDTTSQLLSSREYQLSIADLLLWLSTAPNVSQGGQSYSFTDTQRDDYKKRAFAVYKLFGDKSDPQPERKVVYGYMGSKL